MKYIGSIGLIVAITAFSFLTIENIHEKEFLQKQIDIQRQTIELQHQYRAKTQQIIRNQEETIRIQQKAIKTIKKLQEKQ